MMEWKTALIGYHQHVGIASVTFLEAKKHLVSLGFVFLRVGQVSFFIVIFYKRLWIRGQLYERWIAPSTE